MSQDSSRGSNGEIVLFGVKMHAWTMEDTVGEIARRLRAEIFTQHVVVNVAKLVNLRKDPDLETAVTSCDIVNIDGAGVVLGGRLLGYEIPERVAGIDLFHALLEYCSTSGGRVYLLGAKPEVIREAVKRLKSSYPDLEIAGFNHGYFWDDEASMVEQIRNSGASLLFVGISSPLKEQFINRWTQELGVKFAMGVGGTFDVVAGKVRRAPVWMQNTGLEWVYRIVQEPRRMFGRYVRTNTIFAGMLLSELFRRAFGRAKNVPIE
jgi:N-acetylglucosaminyldiphosphoundecaprenol N-acetyl-beta-D-mannosaminyltransferase